MSDGAQALREQGFQCFDFRADVQHAGGVMGIEHPVFYAGSGPALLVLHELPGLAQSCVDFSQRLIARGFEVFMPLLIGRPLSRQPLLNLARLCISAEFARLRAGESAPLTEWLRQLARRVGRDRGNRRIGVIGMCLTGAFVIPLVLEPGVQAAVASQPSIPFRLRSLFGPVSRTTEPWMTQLNVSDADLQAAAACARHGHKSIMVQRFAQDRLCPRARIEHLKNAFGDRAELHEYATSPLRGRVAGPPHALLTEEYDHAAGAPPDDPTRVALARVVDFFHTHLDDAAG